MTPEQERLLAKAREALAAAHRSIAAGDGSTAANRAYYAMLHAVLAALAGEGVELRRHGAVHAAFGARFAKTRRLDPRYHRWLLDAFDLRLLADYDPYWSLDATSIAETADQARVLIDGIDGFLAERSRSE